MTKFYKVLATATILAMAAVPMAASAHPASHTSVSKSWEAKEYKYDKHEKHEDNDDDENEQHDKYDKNGKHEEKEKHEKHEKHDCDYPPYEEQSMLGTIGQITKFTNDQSGKFITVTGRGVTAQGQDEIVLAITKDTKIVNSKGKKVNLQDIMDGHKVVKAVYSANLTKSVPARGTASQIIVQDQNQQFAAIQGKVTEVKNSKLLVTGKNLYTNADETIVLNLTGKTQIVNEDHKTIHASDIQVGMKIRAFYGPQVAKSLPAQSNASYVIVDTEDHAPVDQVLGTEGVITRTNGSQITVAGKGLNNNGHQEVILNITDDTRIVDRNGVVLSKDVLKENVLVEASYGPVMTFSIPAITTATKIVVKDTLVKVEGTVKNINDDTKSMIYVDVASDNAVDNDIILNITDQTKIVSPSGEQKKLEAGTKVTAYHTMATTRSLPPISNAEVIITN